MDTVVPGYVTIKVNGKEQLIPEAEYYDDLEADLEHEAEWNRIKSNLKDLPEVQQQAIKRWTELEALQEHYTEFSDFLFDAMTELMGFNCSDIQIDIGQALQTAPKYFMIQAQRSQAKSTIVAIFAVWKLIHNPKERILIISAGSDVAMEIANWVIQIIMNWDMLTCLRPDRQHGDRSSAKAFDINWQLKGVEKSPSVACIGVTANMQGRRADLLVPDDIESSKNGLTETQRQNLIHLSRDFTSICQKGQIIYLGTPQTSDSIYNTLPGRGYTIRIWPGRFPTKEQQVFYGEHLAPWIIKKMEADPSLRTGGGILGDEGQPTDPMLLPEQTLVDKALDQGEAYFQLQHMLNTELVDLGRHPLKTRDLIVMPLSMESAPGVINWMPDPGKRILTKYGGGQQPEFYLPFNVGDELFAYESKYMYVDTAGGGQEGDETVAWAIYFLHGYLFLMEMLALPGGYNMEVYKSLSEFAYKHQVNEIGVEQNHGYGALAQNWRPELQKFYLEKTGESHTPEVVDDWVSTQKELRIIDTLEPILGRHRLVLNQDVLEYDQESIKKYPIQDRQVYSFAHQMNKITRDHGALIHEDRLDSAAGGARRYIDRMAVREDKRVEQKRTNENTKFMAEWCPEFAQTLPGSNMGNVLQFHGSKSKRRRGR